MLKRTPHNDVNNDVKNVNHDFKGKCKPGRHKPCRHKPWRNTIIYTMTLQTMT